MKMMVKMVTDDESALELTLGKPEGREGWSYTWN